MALRKFGHFKLVSKISRKQFELQTPVVVSFSAEIITIQMSIMNIHATWNVTIHIINIKHIYNHEWKNENWAAPSEFVSSSIPSWQTLTAHAQPFRGARDLAFCLKVLLDSLLVWASSEGSGETARMRRLAWTFAARIGDKYQIRLARPK